MNYLTSASLRGRHEFFSARRRVMTTVSAVALTVAAIAATQPAHAQQASAQADTSQAVKPIQVPIVQIAQAAQTAQAQTAQAPALEEIVVTGTRVVRNGYEAPTPLTVVGVEQIEQLAPTNLADYVNTLPALVGSASPQSSRTSVSAGGAGLNTLNLRNLGGTRSLVLLDGERSVGSQSTGLVDINTFPQQLITRVDVVTGGASAQYGSDALAGVVNFVLDDKYTGVKGEVQGGVTTYGDDRSLAGRYNRRHGVRRRSRSLYHQRRGGRNDGINGVPRSWAEQGWHIIINPAYAAGNGQPEDLILPQTSQDNQTPGGIITAGPLKGVAFGPGGVPYMFNYGTLLKDPWMQGGSWQANDVTSSAPSYGGADDSLDPSDTRQNAYIRLSYDITDNIQVFGTWNWAYDNNIGIASGNFDPGDITLSVNNAFLPSAIATQLKAAGQTTFSFGTMSGDSPPLTAWNGRKVERYVLGANGKFDMFDSTWTWDGYYQAGFSSADKRFLDRLKDHLALAEQAVVNPATGAIVCASTLTNPNNGCVPYDFFGVGVNSQAAINYLSAYSYLLEVYRQEVMQANLHGTPFSTWAGPVSLAAGIEHRAEGGGGIQNAESAANESFVGNQAPIVGAYHVTEGYIETVVPLAKDYSWAKSLDLNAAIRFTDYSISGYVTTWKLGATWDVIDDVRFRATRSRDIRAPNRNELFAQGIFTGNLVNDPFHNNLPVNVQSDQIGNLNLKPEEADTTGIGIVVQPSFIPGLSASVDYFDVKIDNAIGTVSRQQVPNLCQAGETQFCPALTFDPTTGYLSGVIVQPTNFVVQRERGIDFEASYDLKLSSIVSTWNGGLTFRGLATHYITDYTDDGAILGTTQAVGNNGGSGPPHWKYEMSATYTNDPLILNLTARGISAGVYSNQDIQCTSGCPALTANTTTINNNYMPGALYWDLGTTYKFKAGEADMEAFFTVRNLFNTNPPIAAQGTSGVAFSTPPCNAVLYDCLGRLFHAGIRFKM